MEIDELERHLHAGIPLAGAMGIRVTSVNSLGVRITAPLEPNHNSIGKLFGGSAAAALTIAGWITVYSGLRDAGIEAEIVIQNSAIDYTSPVDADFEIYCPQPSATEWTRFVETLERHGRSRIELGAIIECHDHPLVRFTGRYVARKAAQG